MNVASDWWESLAHITKDLTCAGFLTGKTGHVQLC